MKTEIKDEWLIALRSGKYKQATGKLKSSDGFCCLGVLCEAILAPKEIVKHYAVSAFIDKANYPMSVTLSPETRNEIELSLADSEILMGMNDGSGGFDKRTFYEIAGWIEKNL